MNFCIYIYLLDITGIEIAPDEVLLGEGAGK